MPPSNLLRTLSVAILRRSSICCTRNMSIICVSRNIASNANHLCTKKLLIGHRMMATTTAFTNIGVEELKKYQNNKAATIIDVRENAEINETGILPGGIHIPLGEVGKALQENPDIFEDKYKHAKPSKDSPVIFSCRSGKRSSVAAQTAVSLGYTNVSNFDGGWIEWEKQL